MGLNRYVGQELISCALRTYYPASVLIQYIVRIVLTDVRMNIGHHNVYIINDRRRTCSYDKVPPYGYVDVHVFILYDAEYSYSYVTKSVP